MHHRRDHHPEDYKRRENYQTYPAPPPHEGAATKRKRSPSPYSRDSRDYYSHDQSSYEKNVRPRRSSPPPSYDTRYPAENRDRQDFRKDNRGPPPHRREGGGGSGSIGEKVNYTGKTVHDILGTIASASRTQEGSRFIQRSIEEGTDETRRLIFEELEPSFVSLMTDNFGNYVLQKMVDAATADQIAAVVPRMKDHILELSENGKSNYVVQKIIQFVCKRVGNNSLSEEIEEKYRYFLHDVSDSLQGKLKDLCCHQIGTRVVQSLIAYFPESWKNRLLKDLVLYFDDLAVNYYGSYVLNDALKHGQEDFVDNLANKVQLRVVEYSQDQYASIFVKSFLDNPKHRSNICWEFVNTCFRQAGSRRDNYQESSLVRLLNNGIGLSVLKKVVDVSEEEQTKIIEQYVERNREEIIRTNFGGEFLAAVHGGRKGSRSNYVSPPPPPASVPRHDARGRSRSRDRDGGGAGGEWSRRDEGRYEPRPTSLPPTRGRSRSPAGSPVQHRGDGRSDYYYAGYEKNQRPRSPSPPPSYDTRYPAENRDRQDFRKDNRGPPPHRREGGGGSGSIGEKVNYTGKTVHDILGTIASASRTQEGSRFIQRSIEEGTDETRRLIFEELEPSFVSLMTDNFGNYVLQKMVDAATADQIAAVVPRMKDHILELSENGKSNYVVQKIIQFVCKRVGNNSLSEEIEEKYRYFLHDVSDSLQGKLKDLCCHQIGTRVVQSLIAYFPESWKNRLLKDLVLYFDDLAVNYYGSYVLNDALKHGQEDFVDNLANKVQLRVVEYSQDQYASIFVKSFLDNPKHRSNICWEFVNTCFRQAGSRRDNYQESSLVRLLNNGIGLSVLKKVVDVSEEEQTKIIEQYVERNREEIIRTNFGGEFLAAVHGGRKGSRSNYVSPPPPPASVPRHDARGRSRSRDRDGGGAGGEWNRRDEGRYEPRPTSLPPTRGRSRSRSRSPTGSPVQHRGDGRSDYSYAGYEKNQRPRSPSPPPSYDTRYPAENRDRQDFRKDNRGPPPHRREGGGGSGSIGEKVNYTGKTVHDILGTIASASRTQEGSRFIQRSIEEGTDETRRLIFEELEPSFVSLMTDNFGNYVLQKMVDAATADQIAAVVPRMKDHILELSENGKSNYVVQKIIQFVCKRVGNNSLSEEIEEKYRYFLHDVSDSLQGKLKDLCCHQIGTRVVQSLIAYFPESWKNRLLKDLVLYFDDLAVNYYGSYVLNDALKHGQEDFVDNLANKVQLRVVEYSQDQYASIFVKSFLDNPKHRSNICWEFVNTCFRQAGSRRDNYQESSLVRLLNNGIGLSVLKKVVDVSEEEQTKIIEQYVERNREEIIRTNFGGEFLSAIRYRNKRSSSHSNSNNNDVGDSGYVPLTEFTSYA